MPQWSRATSGAYAIVVPLKNRMPLFPQAGVLVMEGWDDMWARRLLASLAVALLCVMVAPALAGADEVEPAHYAMAMHCADAEPGRPHVSPDGLSPNKAIVRSVLGAAVPEAVDAIAGSWALGRILTMLALLVVDFIIVAAAGLAGIRMTRRDAIRCVVILLVFGLSATYLYVSLAPGGLETIGELAGEVTGPIGGGERIALDPADSPLRLHALIVAALGAIASLAFFLFVCVRENLLMGLLLFPAGAYVQLAGFCGLLVYLVHFGIIVVGCWLFSESLAAIFGVAEDGGEGGCLGGRSV